MVLSDQSKLNSAKAVAQVWLAACLVGIAYYAGTKLGFALTPTGRPISTYWPPNAILLAALLLAPRRIWWILLLAVVILSVISSLLNWNSEGRTFEESSKPARGPVEILTGWISNSGREGNYYKWLIANRLGKLARVMSVRFENRVLPDHPDEPEAVQRYLKAGLDESFVDYPLPSIPFIRRKVTPFDLDVDEAVEFLESMMEAPSGHKHA